MGKYRLDLAGYINIYKQQKIPTKLFGECIEDKIGRGKWGLIS